MAVVSVTLLVVAPVTTVNRPLNDTFLQHPPHFAPNTVALVMTKKSARMFVVWLTGSQGNFKLAMLEQDLLPGHTSLVAVSTDLCMVRILCSVDVVQRFSKKLWL